MLPDQVSNPGPLIYESGALPIALRDPAKVYDSQAYRKGRSTTHRRTERARTSSTNVRWPNGSLFISILFHNSEFRILNSDFRFPNSEF